MKTDGVIEYCSEAEIDNGISSGRFCRTHKFPESSEGRREEDLYFSRQNEFIMDLERRLKGAFGDEVFVSDNVWPSELLKVEVGSSAVTRKLIATVLRFLKENRCSSCVNVVVYEGALGDAGQRYIGRVLIGPRGMVVEYSLKELLQGILRGGGGT